jgi:hypothetical protein
MNMFDCPKCGKKGAGVLNFNLVSECDDCKFGYIKAVFVDKFDEMPAGTIAYYLYEFIGDAKYSVTYVNTSIRNKSFCLKDVVYSGNNVYIGEMKFNNIDSISPKEMLDSRDFYAMAIISSDRLGGLIGSAPVKSICIPNPWKGAPSKFRWAEGKHITVYSDPLSYPFIDNPKEVLYCLTGDNNCFKDYSIEQAEIICREMCSEVIIDSHYWSYRIPASTKKQLIADMRYYFLLVVHNDR